jgi:hypothetical protein
MSKVGLGDLVKDAINGYEGVVFGIEPENNKTYVHFKRTTKDLYGNRYGNQTNRINIKNIVVLRKAEPEEGVQITIPSTVPELEERLNRLMEYLGVEEVTKPQSITINKIKQSKGK